MATKTISLAEVIGWPPEDIRWAALCHFVTRVQEAGVDLVSAKDRDRVVQRHLQPSLEALDLLPDTGQLLDFGSGGGFPAIPIAVAKPGLTVTMVESNSRKAAFLKRVSRETNLMNVQLFHQRVEFMRKECNGYYDLVTARAVADLPILIKWSRRFLKPGGRWILWKGRKWADEGDLKRLKVTLLEERPLSDGGRLLVLRPSPSPPIFPMMGESKGGL